MSGGRLLLSQGKEGQGSGGKSVEAPFERQYVSRLAADRQDGDGAGRGFVAGFAFRLGGGDLLGRDDPFGTLPGVIGHDAATDDDDCKGGGDQVSGIRHL